MSVKEFTVGFSRTINLGNFESARVEASVTMDCRDEDAGEKPEVRAQLVLRELLEITYKEQMKKRKSAA